MSDVTDSQSPPPRPTPQGFQFDLPRLAIILAALLIVWFLPSVVERWQFAFTRGRQRAEVQTAREGLAGLKREGISQALALVPKSVSPSVVHIDTVRIVSRGSTGDEWSYFSQQYQTQGQGSGVIVDPQGYIVTNNHVIEGSSEIQIHLSSGPPVPARVVGADPLTDLAVLKVEAEGLVAAEWGDSDALEVGSLVWAIGNPFGLDRSVTFGIVSAKNRREVSGSPYQEFLQTDAAINPGNSGGPLVDIEGKIVGINTAIIGRAYQGVGFSLPSSTAKTVYERLKSSGKVVRGWLGIAPNDVTPEVAKQLGLESTVGALIVEVFPGTPAAKGGFEIGDVVVKWDGVPVENALGLMHLIARTEVGKRVRATVVRGGAPLELDVTIEERPARLLR